MSRLRWLILIVGIAFAAFSGIWGTGVFDRLGGSSSLDDPNSESQLINQRVIDAFGRQNTDLIAIYSSDTLTVDDAQFRQGVQDATSRVRAMSGVELVTSYYENNADALVSTDHHATYLAVRFASGTKDSAVKAVRKAMPENGLTTQVGGQKVIDLDINGRIGDDIPFAEMIAMPVLLVLLILIFGTLVSAAMPLVIGALAILGAFAAVRVITYFTSVSIFAVNIITILGLGLAVDYGLFIVSRFREELRRGLTPPQAVSRTLATAGRTVVVSGLIVGLSLSSLLMFPQVLLRSMGMGGAAAVLIAMLTSLTVLPALLAIVGNRIESLRLPWVKRRTTPESTDSGWWARAAAGVMRRPVLITIGTVVVLLVLAIPFTKVKFGGVDERVLPAGTQSRVVSERLNTDFGGTGIRPIRVFVDHVPADLTDEYAARIERLNGVRGVQVAAHKDEATLFTVDYTGEANSVEARDLVVAIRDLPRPAGADVLVGGTSASVVDQLDSLSSRLPLMALLVAGVTFLLLALAFGSLVVPLKAIVMNLISIGAAFGVVTWIFQYGHLSGLLNFTPTGYVEASQPILMVAILFGLSTDYEVFLLSRVRERWDALGDNTAAVTGGVQRTGRIITAAAALLCVVVGAFATSGITFIKMVGVGMFVAVVVDATLVRLLLVPATMRLLGRFNWWAPKFLRRLYARYGFHEDDDPAPAARNGEPSPDLVTTR